MKKTIITTAILAVFACQNTWAQNTVELKRDTRVVSYESDGNELEASGWHMELDAGYAPITSWKSSVGDKALKGDYAVGLKLALVYQFPGSDFYLGGVTGLKMYQMSWSGGETLLNTPTADGKKSFTLTGKYEDSISKSYNIPVCARFGACSAISKDVAWFFHIDAGVQFGTNDLKSISFCGEAQAGMYYKSTKIGLGLMAFRPKADKYFGSDENKGFDTCFGLFLGFRLF